MLGNKGGSDNNNNINKCKKKVLYGNINKKRLLLSVIKTDGKK